MLKKPILIIVCAFAIGIGLPTIWPYIANSYQQWSISSKNLYTSIDKELIHSFDKAETYTLTWGELLPEEDRELLTKYQPDADASFNQKMFNALLAANDEAYQASRTSTQTVSTFFDRAVAISGFIVPVELNENRKVTLFFLVPYFGACLHYPPPPPNQIIFVQLADGLDAVDINQAYTLHGFLRDGLFEDPMGTSAYRLETAYVRPYFGQPDDVREH